MSAPESASTPTTEEEAKWTIKQVSCHCDGMGVVPGPEGKAIPCPDCDGKFISTDVFKAALKLLVEQQ